MNIKVALLIIGDEVLYGQTLDTNSHFIAKSCDLNGLSLTEIRTIQDDEAEIFKALKNLSENNHVIITSGGLGPTRDDKTKKVMSELIKSPLEINQEAWRWVKSFCEIRGKNFNDLNQKQAEIPKISKALKNNVGTACGIVSEYNHSVIFNLPGVPSELEDLFTQQVLPEIKKRYKLDQTIHEFIYTRNYPESELSLLLNDLELNSPEEIKWAFLPSKSRVKIRLTSNQENKEFLKALKIKIKNKIPKINLAETASWIGDIDALLKKNNKTLSCAESFTAGQLAQTFTSIPGSSKYFLGSVVAYHSNLKVNLLNVSEQLIKENGAVNLDVAKQMAENVRQITGSDYAISSTGVAGPDKDSFGNEVGLAWVAIAKENKTETFQFDIKNKTREAFSRAVIAKTLNLFFNILQEDVN